MFMTIEHEPDNKLTVQEAKARIEGFIDGKTDELAEEIELVRRWPTNIRLGPVIKRRDQEIASLERTQEELGRVKSYVDGILDKLRQP